MFNIAMVAPDCFNNFQSVDDFIYPRHFDCVLYRKREKTFKRIPVNIVVEIGTITHVLHLNPTKLFMFFYSNISFEFVWFEIIF